MMKSVVMKILTVVSAFVVLAVLFIIIYKIRGGSIDILERIFSGLKFIR